MGIRNFSCQIRFKDSSETETQIIRVDPDLSKRGDDYPEDDDEIFFNCETYEELQALVGKDSKEDFYIISKDDITEIN